MDVVTSDLYPSIVRGFRDATMIIVSGHLLPKKKSLLLQLGNADPISTVSKYVEAARKRLCAVSVFRLFSMEGIQNNLRGGTSRGTN